MSLTYSDGGVSHEAVRLRPSLDARGEHLIQFSHHLLVPAAQPLRPAASCAARQRSFSGCRASVLRWAVAAWRGGSAVTQFVAFLWRSVCRTDCILGTGRT